MVNLANEIDVILFIIIYRQKEKLGSENSTLYSFEDLPKNHF